MKNLIIFIFLILSFFSCDEHFNKRQNDGFYIFGKSKGILDSTKVYLKVQESNKIITLDTTDVISNTFQFKGYINKPEVFGIYIDSIKGSIGLFIENRGRKSSRRIEGVF